MIPTDLPSFPRDVYSSVALNELVTYAVYFLSTRGTGEVVAEDIVAACFRLFPEKFHLRGYPEWPDSTVVNKRWIDCRDKGFLHGSTATGFALTPKGLALAEKTEAVLTGKKRQFISPTGTKSGSEIRTRAGRFVRSLEQSDAFQQFRTQGDVVEITEFDFRSMLLCTMESSASTLRSNLEQFKQSASLYDRSDLLQFLEYCGQKFSNLLSERPVGARKYRGGMLKQKLRDKYDSGNK